MILFPLLILYQRLACSASKDTFDYAALVDAEEELLIGDTALALDHIDVDVEEFEDLKKRIHFLESTIAKHSNKRVVGEEELSDANFMLRELDSKVIKPFEEHLIALKTQMLRPHPKYDNETILQISTLIHTAEAFLETAEERVQAVELMEQEWVAAEEGAKIEEMIQQDDVNQKKVYHKKKPMVWKEDLKGKLENGALGEEGPKAPIKKEGSVIGFEKNKTFGSEEEMILKLQKRKHMVKENRDKVLKRKEQNRHELEAAQRKAETELLKKVKEELDKEGFFDTTEDSVGRLEDPVDSYGPEVKLALKEAADASQKFIESNLHHEDKVLVVPVSSLPPYILLAFAALVLIVFGLVVTAFNSNKTSNGARRLFFQVMTKDATSKNAGYMELDEVQVRQTEDEGANWKSAVWSPFRRHGRQNRENQKEK